MAECVHGIEETWCALCSAAGRHVDTKVTSTDARFDGHCPRCGGLIVEGERIFLVDGDWVDRLCAVEAV